MRIQEIRLSAFGKFHETNLLFPSNFQLIVGRNEAGKTTIVDAIPGILFGFRRGQKNLRERYRPWTGAKYSASLVLAAADGTRYLIGRDFTHDRLEIFRGQGVRLEPLAENTVEQILQEALGLDTPQLFESSVLIRQPEVSLVVKDRMAVSRLAEGLGRKISGGDENAPANQALKLLQDKLAKINTTEGPGSLTELAGEVTARERTLAQIDQGYQRYTALIEERERLRAGVATLEAELNDLSNRIETARLCLSRAEARTRAAEELDRVRGLLAAAKPAGESPPAAPGDLPALDAIHLDPEVLARAEELTGQLTALEIEVRYGDEEIRQYQAEVDLLEREIETTRAKLDGLDEQLLDPEIQNQLAHLLPIINENTGRLGELFPQVDRLLDRLRVLKRIRVTGFILSFPAALAAIAAREFLPKLESLGVAGLAAFLVLVTAYLVFWSSGLRGQARRLSEEIDQRENEFKTRRAEAEGILKGKTASQYQAEMEASKLYRNDLWHLEQALAQKKNRTPPDGHNAEAMAALDRVRRELSAVLAATGCHDLAKLREMVLRQMRTAAEKKPADQPQETGGTDTTTGRSYEELAARELELQEQLDKMAVLPAANAEDLQGLIDEQEKLGTRIGDARLRLAELGAEIRNYQEFVLVCDRFEVEESLAEARARLARAETVQRGLTLAAKRLEEAIFEARAHLGPELQEQTGRILSEITNGRYNEVQIDLTPGNLEIHLRSPETGALIDPALLSMGTVDQLYFALRVALAHHLTHGRRFPLILDDPFAIFDRGRMAATVRMLAHLSRTHQVIWFTLDPNLAGLIRDETGLEPSVEELSTREDPAGAAPEEPAGESGPAADGEPVTEPELEATEGT